MLTSPWLTFTLALLVLSLLTRQPALLAAACALALAEAASWLWGRYALAGVTYQRCFGEARVFFGEQIALDVRTQNRKLLPLAWLAIEDEFPEGLRLAKGRLSPSHKPRRVLLNNLLTLRWYEQITRRYTLICEARGEHTFGPASLRTGDIFGFVDRRERVECLDRLIVYPRLLPVRRAGLPSHQLLGPLRANRRIVDDPLRLAGVRDYIPGDSPRRIHWKASARTGQLYTKLLEPSTETNLTLLLNVSTVDPPWLGTRQDRLELAVIAAASLARAELDAGNTVGFSANCNTPGASRPIQVLPGRDTRQLAHILDACARVTPYEYTSFTKFLRREARTLPWGATLVAISAVITLELATTLLHLRRAGRSVALVLVGDDQPRPALPGVPVVLVRGEEEWRTLDAIHLV